MLRRILAALLATVTLLSLAACGGKSLREKDVALLVQGNLDQLYRGKISPEYGELTGVTPEAAAESYDSSLEAEVAYFCDYFCIDDPTPDTKAQVAGLLDRVCAQSSYSLGDISREADDSYAVTVEILPCSALVRAVEALPDSLGDFRAKYPDAASRNASAAYDADWAGAVFSLLSAQLSKPAESGRTIRATVHVVRGSDGIWTVSGDDLRSVDSAMFLYP